MKSFADELEATELPHDEQCACWECCCINGMCTHTDGGSL
jgi:hypothetical protein